MNALAAVAKAPSCQDLKEGRVVYERDQGNHKSTGDQMLSRISNISELEELVWFASLLLLSQTYGPTSHLI